MHRIARALVAAAFATGLAACQAQQPTPAPSTAPSAGSSSTTKDKAPPPFPGKLSVLTFETGKPMSLARGGKAVTFGLRYPEDMLARPSFDEQHLALISTPDASKVEPGSLVVVDVDGGRHVLADNVPWGGGVAPTWTPDGTAVIHDGVRYEVSGKSHASAGLGHANYLVYSVNGGALAHTRSGTSIEVRPTGGAARSVDISALPGCDIACPSAVQAVSDSGDFVALGRGDTDPGRTTSTTLVVDTRTGRPVDLGTRNGLQHVWFPTGGGAIVADAEGLHVLDATWHETGTFPAPGAGQLFYAA
ncbi:hypothetical protein ACFO1B_26750 [Dactylosporangium siamense]|uniref:Lipoprotein n=1 Tax=Dactylosporangium siamense TaxID=685454 RepID=A0A919U8I7_9ACTN|nr:hypothetical protein [Dactylosporangium siamense]GIG46614.1 hypothetical protein Dsi01nite_046550 [Dactylosporangium siamense]